MPRGKKPSDSSGAKSSVSHFKGSGSAGPFKSEFHHIVISLSDEQARELEELTGQKVKELRITLEDLADISHVLLN
jgi:hypothetical protein